MRWSNDIYFEKKFLLRKFSMPHTNLSEALLDLSDKAMETNAENDVIRECLRHLASIADTDSTPLSAEKESAGLEPKLREMLDSLGNA